MSITTCVRFATIIGHFLHDIILRQIPDYCD